MPTTFSLTGVAVTYDNFGDPVSVTPTTLQALYPNNQAFFSYSVLPGGEGLPFVQLGGTDPLSVTANGTSLDRTDVDAMFGSVQSAQGTHIILGFFDPVTSTDYVFQVGGDPITFPTTPAGWTALDNAILGVGVASGSFAPGQNIPISSLANVGIEESAGITGTNGDDLLQGTAGDDVITTGNSTPIGDQVNGSNGNDSIDMSGNDGVNGYVSLNYGSLSAAIAASINGIANTGTIAKDLVGSDTLINVAKPLNAGNFEGGLEVVGTAQNDTFNLTLATDQWMSVRAGAGADNYTINGTGFVRLDFRDASNGGININLGTRLIMDDGFGNIETINGARGVWEVYGSGFNDVFVGSSGNESYRYYGGNNTLDGGAGFDRVRYHANTVESITADMAAGTVNGTLSAGGSFSDTITGFEWLVGSNGNDVIAGDAAANRLDGRRGDDRLDGGAGNDTLNGDDGTDILIGGTGDDFLFGGTSTADLRDVIYGGDGNDSIDGGYGNDELRGDAGNDTVAGGFGADTVIGGAGDDVLTGSAYGDVIFGSDGNDFINGGFGFDRVNGGAGADKFYHLGIRDHGSDWIQDYNSADGDVLQFGGAATVQQFQVNRAATSGAGAAGVDEAFVIYKPTGQILWALVDGFGNDEITLRLGGQDFDLFG